MERNVAPENFTRLETIDSGFDGKKYSPLATYNRTNHLFKIGTIRIPYFERFELDDTR